jgi:hypothetical protein
MSEPIDLTLAQPENFEGFCKARVRTSTLLALKVNYLEGFKIESESSRETLVGQPGDYLVIRPLDGMREICNGKVFEATHEIKPLIDKD